MRKREIYNKKKYKIETVYNTRAPNPLPYPPPPIHLSPPIISKQPNLMREALPPLSLPPFQDSPPGPRAKSSEEPEPPFPDDV